MDGVTAKTEELFREDAYLKMCEAAVIAIEDGAYVLDRTVFYATSGGQPGDTGSLSTADGRMVVVRDATKGAAGVRHVPAPDSPALAPGEIVTAVIDWDRRHRHMRMHTALHLVSAAVAGDITGAQVGAERSRVDFNLAGEVPTKESVTEAVNKMIALDRAVTPRWVTDEELAARPELVRSMSVRPPTGMGRVRLLDIEGIDLQACGGTHVARIGEIGRFEVVKIENKGKSNRRFIVALA
ncbi:MAG: alanyl-tRNA editing protein [Rhodospirillales bacterium]|nr:MAG: alanyl-tRNA editing protein [Rhodospirillales bacterium]